MECESLLDGIHWQLAENAERRKPADVVPEGLKKTKRRVSDSPGTRGRPRIALSDCEESTKATKLRLLHEKMLAAAQAVLDAEEDEELVDAWNQKYEWFGAAPLDDNSPLSNNVREFYHSLPQNSIIKTVLIKDLYKGYTQGEIMELLGLSQARVSEALSAQNTKPLSYYLSSLGIPRNRCPLAEMYVLNWFAFACPVPSGRNNRVFFGTAISMYFEYRMWCAQCEVCSVIHFLFIY